AAPPRPPRPCAPAAAPRAGAAGAAAPRPAGNGTNLPASTTLASVIAVFGSDNVARLSHDAAEAGRLPADHRTRTNEKTVSTRLRHIVNPLYSLAVFRPIPRFRRNP